MTNKVIKGEITNEPTTEEPPSYECSSEPEIPFDPLGTKDRPRRMSAHVEAYAARAMRRTNSWTPVFERRQSWSKEDHKHVMHMAYIDGVKTGPGFTER
ncbi:hypothetical protein AUP68_15197 [Ilyonectria robusta]